MLEVDKTLPSINIPTANLQVDFINLVRGMLIAVWSAPTVKQVVLPPILMI